MWLVSQRGSRSATIRVPSRSICKSDLPRSLPGSATSILLSSLETKSADFLCQALEVLRSLTAYGLVFLPQSAESHLSFVQLTSVQLPRTQPPNRLPCWRPKLLSSPYSLDLILCSPLPVPRVIGELSVRQAETPCLVMLQYLWEVAWYPRGRRSKQTNTLPFIP